MKGLGWHAIAASLFFVLSVSTVAAKACTKVEELDSYVRGASAPGPDCSRFQTVGGGTGASCYWAFPFRSDAAVMFADGLWSDVLACRPGKVLGPDAQVNHPDSYDLRARVTPDATYRVSIKDKGGLQQTLVFLRVER